MNFKLQTIATLCAVSMTAGCVAGPQTAEATRSMVSNSMFGKTTNVQVGRSISAVNASLSAGAQKCLNRVVSSTFSSPGMYGRTSSTISQKFSTTYKANANSGEMAMSTEYVGGPVLNNGVTVIYVVDAKPVSGGTTLTIHGGKWGMKAFDASIVNWAKGGALTCPPMPGHST